MSDETHRHREWSGRVRNAFCPECGEKIEWPEGTLVGNSAIDPNKCAYCHHSRDYHNESVIKRDGGVSHTACWFFGLGDDEVEVICTCLEYE